MLALTIVLSAQVNDLSPSLLAFLLLPRLLDTAKKYNTIPRIVLVTSELHFWAQFEKKLVEAPNPLRLFAHKEHMSGPYVTSKVSYCCIHDG